VLIYLVGQNYQIVKGYVYFDSRPDADHYIIEGLPYLGRYYYRAYINDPKIYEGLVTFKPHNVEITDGYTLVPNQSYGKIDTSTVFHFTNKRNIHSRLEAGTK
jgi:hypothetical protein